MRQLWVRWIKGRYSFFFLYMLWCVLLRSWTGWTGRRRSASTVPELPTWYTAWWENKTLSVCSLLLPLLFHWASVFFTLCLLLTWNRYFRPHLIYIQRNHVCADASSSERDELSAVVTNKHTRQRYTIANTARWFAHAMPPHRNEHAGKKCTRYSSARFILLVSV